jgi:hypothetical protein
MIPSGTTPLMGWEGPGASVLNPGAVTHIVIRGRAAVCGAWIRSVGPRWPAPDAAWIPQIRACVWCELLAFGEQG